MLSVTQLVRLIHVRKSPKSALFILKLLRDVSWTIITFGNKIFTYFLILIQKNNGICIENGAFDEFSCNCSEPYGGRRCEIELCKTLKCMNDGFCSVYIVDGEREEICDCRKDISGEDIFIGDRCQTPAVCAGDPCLNGGSCSFANIDDPWQLCFTLIESD